MTLPWIEGFCLGTAIDKEVQHGTGRVLSLGPLTIQDRSSLSSWSSSGKVPGTCNLVLEYRTEALCHRGLVLEKYLVLAIWWARRVKSLVIEEPVLCTLFAVRMVPIKKHFLFIGENRQSRIYDREGLRNAASANASMPFTHHSHMPFAVESLAMVHSRWGNVGTNVSSESVGNSSIFKNLLVDEWQPKIDHGTPFALRFRTESPASKFRCHVQLQGN